MSTQDSQASSRYPVPGVTFGNAAIDGKSHRQWFVGRYIDEDAFRQTSDVEVKWGVHKKGERNEKFAADQVARSMSILIQGDFQLTFRRDNVDTVVRLSKQGDYALWLPGVYHTWEAISDEDTIILTVRWPSLPVMQTGHP